MKFVNKTASISELFLYNDLVQLRVFINTWTLSLHNYITFTSSLGFWKALNNFQLIFKDIFEDQHISVSHSEMLKCPYRSTIENLTTYPLTFNIHTRV